MAKEFSYYKVNLPLECEAKLAGIMAARGLRGTRPGAALTLLIEEEYARGAAKSAAKNIARNKK